MGATICTSCSKPYAPTREDCPHCGAENPAITKERTHAQASAREAKVKAELALRAASARAKKLAEAKAPPPLIEEAREVERPRPGGVPLILVVTLLGFGALGGIGGACWWFAGRRAEVVPAPAAPMPDAPREAPRNAPAPAPLPDPAREGSIAPIAPATQSAPALPPPPTENEEREALVQSMIEERLAPTLHKAARGGELPPKILAQLRARTEKRVRWEVHLAEVVAEAVRGASPAGDLEFTDDELAGIRDRARSTVLRSALRVSEISEKSADAINLSSAAAQAVEAEKRELRMKKALRK